MIDRELQIANLEQRLKDKDRQIAELLSSTSWRITRPLRGIRSFLSGASGSIRTRIYRIARAAFHTAPLSPRTRHKLRRWYRNHVATRHGAGILGQYPSTGLKRSRVIATGVDGLRDLVVPEDGRWQPDFFQKNQDYIRALAAALSSPDDKGPIRREEIDVRPAATGPLVTIIVRTYAGRWSLAAAALESIRSQSYRPIEVIVVEDGAGVYSDKITELDVDGDCKFRHMATGGRLGRSAAANIALDHAKGDFIGFLDDDDYLLENHCGLLAACLMQRKDMDAVYAASEEVETTLDKTEMRFVRYGNKTVFFYLTAVSGQIFSYNCFPIQAILFRKSLCFPRVRFDCNLDALEDWLFWMRLLSRGRVGLIAEITSVFHVPQDREQRRRLKAHREAECYLDIQRTAIFEIHGLRDMKLVDEDARYLLHKARQRASLPIATGGEGHVEPAVRHSSPLRRALGEDPSPVHLAPSFDRRIAAFTSINLRYLPKALAWAESVKRHNPDWEVHVLLNDSIPSEAADWPNVDVVYPVCNLDVPSLHSWIFGHDVTELCTATKPFYAKYLLDARYEYVFYFDPDTYVYDDLEVLVDELEDYDVLLTPHCVQDAATDVEIHYNEMSALAHGIFNLGFVGFKQGTLGNQVAAFWKRRLLRYCRDDHARGLFNDQKWFNFVPVFFDRVKILKHKGCNTASWNISHRPVARKQGRWTAGGDPLVFFHFSGYDRDVPRTMFEIFGQYNEAVIQLLTEYDRIVANFARNHDERKSEWIYARYDNGVFIDKAHRQYYRERFEHQIIHPHPFYTGHDRSYFRYISEMGSSHITRYVNPDGWLRRYF